MNKIKVRSLVAGLVISVLALVTISPVNAASKPIKLAGHLPNIFDPFWISVQCGADSAARAAGIKITWANTQTTDAAQQNQAITTALLSKPQAFIVSPGVEVNNALKTMMKKGIAVSALNQGGAVSGVYYQTATSGPADQSIKDAAKMILADVGTTGSVAIFAGMAGAQWAIDRYQPIVDLLKAQAPDVKILPIQYEGFDSNKTATMVTALITANPDLKVIYGNTGPSGQGIVAGVEQNQMQGKIKVYSFDAVPALVAGLKRGTVSALLAQPAGLMGKMAVQTAISWVRANPNNKKSVRTNTPADILLPMMLLTKDNVNEPAAKDYQYVAKCSK